MIVLASASPRRKAFMKEFITPSFLIDVSHIDEKSIHKQTPLDTVKAIAKAKGEKIFNKHPQDLIISADTIVVLDEEIIGKPKDDNDAFNMLKKLCGKTHQVITAFYIRNKDVSYVDAVISKVKMKTVDPEILIRYIETKSPLDKAGGYGIQDEFFKQHLYDSHQGSISNIIGFPYEEIKEFLEKNHLI